jgi:hypothetical protein
LIDQTDGPEHIRSDPYFALRSKGSVYLASEFVHIVTDLQLPGAQKREIMNLVCSYRRNYIRAMVDGASELTGVLSFDTVLREKTEVVGGLWATWARILGIIYGLADDQIEAGAMVLHAFGMIVQIADDIYDLPEDLANSQANMFAALCGECSVEEGLLRAHLAAHRGRHLNRRWAKANLPVSYRRMELLAHGYLGEVARWDDTGVVIGDVRHCTVLLMRPFGL